jgi:hypothetical protein
MRGLMTSKKRILAKLPQSGAVAILLARMAKLFCASFLRALA